MTTHSQWPSATRPAALGNPVSRFPAPGGANRSRRRASLLARAWYAVYAAWLRGRLARIETELQARTTRLPGHVRDDRSAASRKDLPDLESCHMERAVLLARLARCRSMR